MRWSDKSLRKRLRRSIKSRAPPPPKQGRPCESDEPGEVLAAEAEALLHVRLAPLVLRVLVLDGEHAVVAGLAEGADERAPVDLALPRHPVAPGARLPGVGAELLPERAVAVAALGEDLGVLRVGVEDAGRVLPHRALVVDAEPEEVRGVEVEAEALARDLVEQRIPELGRVGVVAGPAERHPVVHRAVLDHQADAFVLSVLDERAERLPDLLQDRVRRPVVPADERPDEAYAELLGRVDDLADVGEVG